ncbi:MAG: hypothetical protein IJ379_03195 [Lachnospiraceae bacterium]|nr:hypothetical protein [Lachnospiraceae bacterium]
MKKKVVVGMLIGIIVLLLIGVVWFANRGFSFSTARGIETRQSSLRAQRAL